FNGINLFVRDLTMGTTSLISATTGGKLSNSNTFPLLAPDGHTIFFNSNADNLVSNDSNHTTDIFAATLPVTSSNPPANPDPSANPNPPTSPTTPSSTTEPTTPVHAATPQPGPTVLSVATRKGRRGIQSIVINFDRALDLRSAINAANYEVTLARQKPL